MSTHTIAETRTTTSDDVVVVDDEHGGLVRSLSATLPPLVGNALATLVVLVSLVIGVISLVATWSGNAGAFLPLFQVTVAATVVSLNASTESQPNRSNIARTSASDGPMCRGTKLVALSADGTVF